MESVENIFRALIRKIYAKDIVIPPELKNYKKCLEICMDIDGLSAYNKLLLSLFDIVFLENYTPKKIIEPDLLKAFELCLEDKFEESFLITYVHSKETQLSEALNKNIFSERDLRLVSVLMTIKPDFNLLFSCFENFLVEKCEKYIPIQNKEKLFDESSFEKNLEDFADFYNMINIKYNKYFSIVIKDGWILTKDITAKELNDYKANIKRKRKLNDLINFLNQIKPKSKNEGINQIVPVNSIENDDNKEFNKDILEKIERLEKIIADNRKEMNDMKEREIKANNTHIETLNGLKAEIQTLKEREIKANNTHRETLNGLKAEIQTLQKNSVDKKEVEKMRALLKQHKESISLNTATIEQLRDANRKLKDKIKIINNELDTIKQRGVSKSLIDFISYSLGQKDINISFSEKITFIINKLNNLIEKEKLPILTELKKLIDEINIIKITGDNFAHSILDLDSLLGLINGCDNAKKILLELNLSSMIKSCNEMYKMQSLKIDYSNLYESIIKVMETKKVLFCAKLGFKLSI